MTDAIKAQILSFLTSAIRHLITITGGWLLKVGYDSTQVTSIQNGLTDAISGGVLVVIALAWSWFAKKTAPVVALVDTPAK